MSKKTTLPAIAPYLFFLLACLACLKSYSQQEKTTMVSNVTRLTFLNPGISQEITIGKRQTLFGQLFVNTSASAITYNNGQDININFYFDPALSVQLRHYYNGERRSGRGKRTEMNSMNYFAAIAETFISKYPANSDYIQEKRRPVTTLGAAWGLQRNYKGRFSLDLYLGAGYRFARSTIYTIPQPTTVNPTELILVSQINIGGWLNKRKD